MKSTTYPRRLIIRRRPGWAATLLLAATLLPGCSNLRDLRDSEGWVGDLVEPIVPLTPGEAARDAFNVYDPDKRRRGIAALGSAYFGGEPRYLRLYRLLLDYPDPTVRAACAHALALHGEIEDAERLVPLLDDEDPYVRWEAAKALQRIHAPEAALPLVETVASDEDADVRMSAALALGQYRQPAVFNALVGALADTDFGVAYTARYSLYTLTGMDQGPRTGDWLRWAEDREQNVFADAQPYTYLPYDPPETFWQTLRFWEEHPPPPPRTPVGLEVVANEQNGNAP